MSKTKEQHPFLDGYFGKKSFEEVLSLAQSKEAEDIQYLIGGVAGMMQDEDAKNLTYTQVRNILQLVKGEKFDAKSEDPRVELFKTLPMLAYIEARLKKNEGREMAAFIRKLATSVGQGQYSAFIDIMNAIVAYHKLNQNSK